MQASHYRRPKTTNYVQFVERKKIKEIVVNSEYYWGESYTSIVASKVEPPFLRICTTIAIRAHTHTHRARESATYVQHAYGIDSETHRTTARVVKDANAHTRAVSLSRTHTHRHSTTHIVFGPTHTRTCKCSTHAYNHGCSNFRRGYVIHIITLNAQSHAHTHARAPPTILFSHHIFFASRFPCGFLAGLCMWPCRVRVRRTPVYVLISQLLVCFVVLCKTPMTENDGKQQQRRRRHRSQQKSREISKWTIYCSCPYYGLKRRKEESISRSACICILHFGYCCDTFVACNFCVVSMFSMEKWKTPNDTFRALDECFLSFASSFFGSILRIRLFLFKKRQFRWNGTFSAAVLRLCEPNDTIGASSHMRRLSWHAATGVSWMQTNDKRPKTQCRKQRKARYVGLEVIKKDGLVNGVRWIGAQSSAFTSQIGNETALATRDETEPLSWANAAVKHMWKYFRSIKIHAEKKKKRRKRAFFIGDKRILYFVDRDNASVRWRAMAMTTAHFPMKSLFIYLFIYLYFVLGDFYLFGKF